MRLDAVARPHRIARAALACSCLLFGVAGLGASGCAVIGHGVGWTLTSDEAIALPTCGDSIMVKSEVRLRLINNDTWQGRIVGVDCEGYEPRLLFRRTDRDEGLFAPVDSIFMEDIVEAVVRDHTPTTLGLIAGLGVDAYVIWWLATHGPLIPWPS
jgi:hypothetical protein